MNMATIAHAAFNPRLLTGADKRGSPLIARLSVIKNFKLLTFA
jgi:hypothetical protein